MKKILFVLIIQLLSSLVSIAQVANDLIIKRAGEEIKSKVKSVSETEIEYTKFDNLSGPVYKIAKAEVLLIMYANGTKDIFTVDNTKTNNTATASNRPAQRYRGSDFFSASTPFVYLGVDFSQCKLIGEGFENPKTMFNEINTLVEKEKSKYDIRHAVRKSNISYEYAIVDKKNA